MFYCGELVESDVDKLKLCIKNLDFISEINKFPNYKPAEQSLLLDVLVEVGPCSVETVSFCGGDLSTECWQKLLPIIPKIRN